MSTTELLWTLQEERRREAEQAARERRTRPAESGSGRSAGRLVGWIRDRLRVLREPVRGSAGWGRTG
jgi:hypothetical protein